MLHVILTCSVKTVLLLVTGNLFEDESDIQNINVEASMNIFINVNNCYSINIIFHYYIFNKNFFQQSLSMGLV